jgi:hypothetical protein
MAAHRLEATGRMDRGILVLLAQEVVTAQMGSDHKNGAQPQ